MKTEWKESAECSRKGLDCVVEKDASGNEALWYKSPYFNDVESNHSDEIAL